MFAPKDIHDQFSQKTLRQALMDARGRRLPPLAHFRWELNGRRMPTFADLLLEQELSGKVGLIFYQPNMRRESWEFTTPVAAMAFEPKGAGKIVTFEYDPTAITPWNLNDRGTEDPCVVRFSVRESFIPRSIKQEQEALRGTPPPGPQFELFSLSEIAKFVRSNGVVPFRVELMVYTSKMRHAYDLDVVNGLLVQDPRSGRFAVTERIKRSPRLYHGLDRYIARREIPPIPSRILEFLFEAPGLNPTDVTVLLGISPELAAASFKTLEERQLCVWDKGTRTYFPLPRGFLTLAEAEMERREEERAVKMAMTTPETPTPAPTPMAAPAPVKAPAPRVEPAAEVVRKPEPVQPAPKPQPSVPPPASQPPLTSFSRPAAKPVSPPKIPEPPPKAAAPAPAHAAVQAPAPPAPVPAQPPAQPARQQPHEVAVPEIDNVRNDVRDLLEMMESSTKCPVCGGEMEPSETEIVCKNCQKEMGNSAS